MSFEQKQTMKVAICDDEEVIHTIVKAYLREWEERNQRECELYHFYTGEQILTADACWDVLLLDVCMPGMDGIETAHALNRVNRKYKIVMLTSMEEAFKDAFRIGAYRFVTKPVQKEELWEALDAVERTMVGSKPVEGYRDKCRYELNQWDILYISGKDSQTEIYTESSNYRSDHSLNEWEHILDERLFCRCHRSYIVNLSKIQQMDAKIHLTDGEVLLLSRRRRKELEERFAAFLGNCVQ